MVELILSNAVRRLEVDRLACLQMSYWGFGGKLYHHYSTKPQKSGTACCLYDTVNEEQ